MKTSVDKEASANTDELPIKLSTLKAAIDTTEIVILPYARVLLVIFGFT